MTTRGRRWLVGATIVSVLAAVVFVGYRGLFVTPYDLRVVRAEIPVRSLTGGAVRIVLFSDVDFPRYTSNLALVEREAPSFDPDLVLVAGDFLDRDTTARDPVVLGAAAEWFDRLPAAGRRFLAPGESESLVAGALAASWRAEVIEPVVNDSRRFVVRGQSVDLFVADRRMDPAPWTLALHEGRPVLQAACRGTETWLQFAGGAGWGDLELTVAFRTDDREQRILVLLAADVAADPASGSGVVVFRDEDHPGFRVRAQDPRWRRLEGRTFSGFVPPTGVWTRCRIRITDDGAATRVRARFWPEEAAEPPYWTIDATDDAPGRRRGGSIAFGGERGLLRFADLRVTGASGRLLLAEDFSDPSRFRGDWLQRSRLGAWLASEPAGTTRLILAHEPDIVRDIVALRGRVDLVLAGHTHGGQVRLPWFGPIKTDTKLGRHYDRGLFDYAGMPLFITAGIGTSVVPIRWGAPPDCAFLTLVPSSGRGSASARTGSRY